MENQNKIFGVLQETGLNWSVDKRPLFDQYGNTTNSFGLYKKDSSDWFGTVGSQYVPYQNHQLVKTIVEASEGISDNVTGGFLRGGKKVYLQVNLKDVQVADDTIKRNITALNSHDGSTAIGFGSSNTVVVCQNTFYMAYKEVKKFRHTASADEQISIARASLNTAILNDAALMENFKRMTDIKIEKPIFESVVSRLFDVDMGKGQNEISTVTKNKMTVFNTVLESELDSHGENLWGLFNAVTFYTNHRQKAGKADDEVKNHLLFGGGYEKNLMTYEEIMKFVSSKSKTTVVV